MLQRYDGIVPSGVTVGAARMLAQFFPVAGTLTAVTLAVNVANAGGDTVFDVRKNGATIYASPTDRPKILSGTKSVAQAGLAVVVALGDLITVHLISWPTGGLLGPGLIEVGVDDGVAAGAAVTDGTTTIPAPTVLTFGAGDVANPSGTVARIKSMADAIAALGANDAAGRYKLTDAFISDGPLAHSEFVRHYYFGILARQPTTGELNSDVAALAAACIAATFVTQAAARIDALFIGAEFVALGTTTAQFINAVYRAYFNRDPDASGLTFWTNELNVVGTTRANMRLAFASHQEFINRAAMYCRSQLPDANARLILGAAPTAFVQGVVSTVVGDVGLVVYTTAALADGASENVSLGMGGKYWKLYRVQVDHAARVRAYLRDAQRTADAARPFGTDPTGEHGNIYDLQLLTNLDWDCEPRPDGCNMDDLTSSNSWVRITNLSGATNTVQIQLHRRLL